MTTEVLPPAISAFFGATNTTDRRRFLGAFAEDAVLDDWGRQFVGKEGISGWNETDNMGVSSHIDVIGVRVDGGSCVVSIQVSGDGYNGGGAMTFRLEDGLISRVDITG
jgi:hypothetical protein